MIEDAIGFLSLAMIGLGFHQIYEPLGLIIPGTVIFCMMIGVARKKGK